ncbi:MAG TPA: AsmA-like C-terminal region-containing protein [Stellaceae bacterium]|nr:AsmA-like C-terminal region-containing protein [Stellaceae bacterium]
MDSETRHEDEPEVARPDPAGQAPEVPRAKRKRRPVRHGTVLVLRILSALVTAIAIAVIAIGWRLASGPISLDFLTPTVQSVLSNPERGIEAAIEHTELTLEPTTHTVSILAEGVTIRRSDGSAGMRLPRVTLKLSLRALLTGQIAPTTIVLTAPQFRLAHAPDGTIHLGFGEGAGSEDLARTILQDIEVRPNQRGPLGYLQEVDIRDATLILDDRALGVTWQARDVQAILLRNQAGLAGQGSVTVVTGDQEAKMDAIFQYVDAEHRLTGEVDVADLDPARFAAAAQPLALLAALKVPLSGSFGFTIDVASLTVEGARCDVTLKSGRIDAPFLSGGSLPITGGAAKLSYAPLTGRLSVDELRLDLDGPTVALTAEVSGVDPQFLRGGTLQKLDISTKLKVQHVAFDTLARYWPDAVSRSSRSWITGHVRDGTADVDGLEVHAVLDLTGKAAKPLVVDSAHGTLSFSNLTIDYFPPLPPVREVSGTGSFDRAHMDLVPTGGTLAGLRVTSATIRLTKLDTDDETIAIGVGVHGPVHDVLDAIDTKPLRYAHVFGVDPAKVTGAVDVQVSFGFPLIHDLRIDDVDYSAKAKIAGASIPGIAMGHDLSEGDITLEVDRTSLKVKGTGKIEGVAAEFTWAQSLRSAGGSRHYTVKTRLDDVERRRLGVDLFPEMVSGPVGIELAYSEQKGTAEAEVSLDLLEASLDVKDLGWKKSSGVAAVAKARLGFSGGKLASVSDATLDGGGMNAALSVAFAPETQELRSAAIRRLAFGDTDIAGNLERRSSGWVVALTGKSFDASKFLSDLGRGRVGGREIPLSIEAKLDRLILGPGRELSSVSLSFVDDGTHWQRVVLNGRFAAGGRMVLRFGEPPGSRALTFESNDLGSVLKVLGVSTAVVGGQVRITAQSEDRGKERLFGGHLEGADFTVVHAPLMARLLSVASLSGIASLLDSDEGVAFTRLRGDFTYDGGKLKVSEVRAVGNAIGITAGGGVDIGEDTVDLAGVLVPAYTINSLIGNVPLIGDVLAPDGSGVFAVNFRVAGPVSDPKVNVNPLSTLAPGFLRKLFMFAPSDPSKPPSDPSEVPFSNDTGH